MVNIPTKKLQAARVPRLHLTHCLVGGDGRQVTIDFSRPITVNNTSGFTLSAEDSVDLTHTGTQLQSMSFEASRFILLGEVCGLNYIPDPGDIRDTQTNQRLKTVVGYPVENDSQAGGDMVPPQLISGTVSMDGNSTRMLFDEPVTGSSGFTMTASGGACTMTYSSGMGSTELVYANGRTLDPGETVSVGYADGDITDLVGNPLATIVDFQCYNNPDTILPTVLSAAINSAGTLLTVVMSESCTGTAGFTLNASGGAASLTYSIGEGTNIYGYTIGRVVGSGETRTLDFTPGTVEDLHGNALAAFTDLAVSHQGTAPPGAIIMDAAWLATNGPAPYLLNQNSKTYWLDADFNADGRAFTLTGKPIILDLNGHTVTYQNVGAGVSNPGFETAGGSASIPADWDITGAPGATRASTADNAIAGRWYLNIATSDLEQEVVSSWTDLPASTSCVAIFWRDNAFTTTPTWIRWEVEHSTLGILASMYSDLRNDFTFNSSATPGDYRIRFAVVPQAQPAWEASTTYVIGDRVTPTTPNGNYYFCTKSSGSTSGLSGGSQPTWNTTLGSVTTDNQIEWICDSVGTSDAPASWQANRVYFHRSSRIRPTAPNGCTYYVNRILINGTSGATEPAWTPTGGTVATIDNQLEWKRVLIEDDRFDEINVVPEDVSGVYASYVNQGTSTTDITIRNGTIEQGGRGFQCVAVNVRGVNQSLIEDLTITTHGLESPCIYAVYGSYSTIRNNTVVSNGDLVFNRHQINGAISDFYCANSTIHNNSVTVAGLIGVLVYNTTDCTAHTNTVATSSVTTNHYAMFISGDRCHTRANIVVADPGQGLRVNGVDAVCEDNTITINSVAPNADIGRYSLDAIRVNDYGGGTNTNLRLSNNTIVLNGNNSPHYTVGTHVLNGIIIVSPSAGIICEGNDITCNRIDDEVKCSGFQPRSYPTNTIIYRNNTITSDQRHFNFAGYSSSVHHNSRWENTTFTQGINPGSDYALFVGDANTRTGINHIMIDTTINGPGTLQQIVGGPTWANPPLQWTVRSTVSITVEDGASNPVVGATVTIFDAFDTEVFSGVTDGSGQIPGQELTAYTMRSQSASPFWIPTNYTPHRVVVGAPISDEFEVTVTEAAQSVLIEPA